MFKLRVIFVYVLNIEILAIGKLGEILLFLEPFWILERELFKKD